MSVRVITDSASDIPPSVAKELGIIVVPLTVMFCIFFCIFILYISQLIKFFSSK